MKYLAERAFTDIFLDFKSVGNVVFSITDVLAFIVVKAAIFRTVGSGQKLTTYSLFSINIVDLIEI